MVPTCSRARSAFWTSGRPTEIWSRAGALDLGLRDAERVDALAHRLDRVVDRLRRDLGHLRRRLALVDELDAALEVEPELRVLRERRARDDHEQRQHEQRRRRAARIVRLRVRLVIVGVSTSRRPAVVVVGGEDVRLRRLRRGLLRRARSRLVEHAHAPLERGADVVLAGSRTRGSSTSCTGLPITSRSPRPGQLARPAPGADQAALLVEQEEGGVGRRVVVVEQLEQEAEAAFRCSRARAP